MIHEHDRNSVYKRFRGGYEFVHDHDDKISKETWIETAKPYLLDHLSLQEVNEWEDKVLNEKKIPIIEKVTSILKDEKTIADKVTDEAATKDKTVTAEDAVVDKTKPELGKINPFMKFVYAIFKPSKLNKKDNKQLAKEYRADNGAEPVKAKTDATKNEDTPNKGVN